MPSSSPTGTSPGRFKSHYPRLARYSRLSHSATLVSAILTLSCIADADTSRGQWDIMESKTPAATNFGIANLQPCSTEAFTIADCAASDVPFPQHNTPTGTKVWPARGMRSVSSPQIVQKGSRFFVAPIGCDIVVIRELMREKGFLHVAAGVAEQPTHQPPRRISTPSM